MNETTPLDPVNLLIGLVQRTSPSGAERSAVRYLVDRMRAAGFKASVDRAGNAVGAIGEGSLHIMLLGHVDTVPGEIAVRVQGDTLYGRGTVDAKGALAAFVSAAALRPTPRLRITVVGAVGEEADSPGARYLRDHSTRPDFLVVGEPSRWDRVTLGYKGSAWFDLLVSRSTAHTASNEASACELAVAAWQRLVGWTQAYNEEREGAFAQLTPTLRAMQSESDGLEDRAQLRVGFRLPVGLDPAALRAEVESRVGCGVRVAALPGAVRAYRAAKNTPLVRAAVAAIRAEGGQPTFVLKSGTSDLNVVAPRWECPAIAYGPGDSTLDHTPGEHLSLSEYQRSIAVLRRLLSGLAGG